MKFLRSAYSLNSGTRRYRKIKALQLFANLQLQRTQNKKGQTKVPNKKEKKDNKYELENNSESNSNQQKEEEEKEEKIAKTKTISKVQKGVKGQQKEKIPEELIEDAESELLSEESSEQFSIGEQFAEYSLELSNGDILLFMKDNQKIVVYGEFQFVALHGSVQINGFTSTARNSIRDFQKHTLAKVSSLPKNSLLCFDSFKTNSSHKVELKGSELLQLVNHNAVLIANKQDVDKLIDQICENWSQIEQKITSDMRNVMYIHHPGNSEDSQYSFQIHEVLSTSEELQNATGHIRWTQEQQQFIKEVVTQFSQPKQLDNLLLCGNKNCGKSMFTLYSINKLLDSFERVCILDTDLGQSLFHFPGTVNLFSVSRRDIEVSNLSVVKFLKPVASVLVGEFSPQKNIEGYINGIVKCHKFYREYFGSCPLVINTHGFITNIGELLLYDIIHLLQPSCVALLSQNSKILQNLKDNKLRDKRLSLLDGKEYLNNHRLLNSFQPSKVVDLSTKSFTPDSLKVNEAKRHRKDEIMYQYFTHSNQSHKALPFSRLFRSHYGQLCLQPWFTAPISQLSFVDLDSRSTILHKQSDSKLKKRKASLMEDIPLDIAQNIEENQEVNAAELVAAHFNCSIVAMFDNSYSIGQNPTDNCIGFGYIRDVDLVNKSIHLIANLSLACDLPRVSTLVKSSEISFSKHFYLKNAQNLIEISELSYDLAADFTSKRTIDIPFLLPKSCGLGNFSFRSRVSNRK